MLSILHDAEKQLRKDGATALDVATYAVTLLENNLLFNSGRGAVFTRDGTHELEASVMVSRGYRKRGVGVMRVTSARNPILLAKEMLVRGEADNGGGAGPHCQLVGETCDKLAEQWGLELVRPSYWWTRKRWDEHRQGLGLSHDDETYQQHRREADGDDALQHANVADVPTDDQSLEEDMWMGEFACDEERLGNEHWNGSDYLPQGTVGAVVLDSAGVACVATSTGGLTNKLRGRIGDTPTLGAGFWAEEWDQTEVVPAKIEPQRLSLASLPAFVSDCIPGLSGYLRLSTPSSQNTEPTVVRKKRAAAMSGTGNGDSFLRIAAVRTASAIARFSPGGASLQNSVTAVAGPNGMLQQSAGDRWHKTGEGEGGIIGIELNGAHGKVVADFNCGGMFRAWVDDEGTVRMAVFRDEVHGKAEW